MFNTIKGRRMGAFLAAGGALLLASALVLVNPGVIPGVEAATPPSESCEVTYFALNPSDPSQPDPAKEVPAAFGTAVTARGEQPVKAELNERRECGADGKFDPALTASHYAAWSEAGLTARKVDYTGIDAFYAEIAGNKELYNQVLTELKQLENQSAYTEEAVPAGVFSLFMVPNGTGGVNVGQGLTSADGTNAVFTHSGAVVKYRLDCGFQVNRSGAEGGKGDFPGVPQCTPEQCPPPVCPPGMEGDWPNCHPPCPPNTTPWPECNNLKWVTPTTQEPGWVPDGTGNGVTDGQQSADQIASGETRGNAVNDQVPNNANTNTGGTTPDTAPSNGGGPIADGATSGGDDQSSGEVDHDNTNQDPGGTSGDTCVPDGVVVLTCP